MCGLVSAKLAFPHLKATQYRLIFHFFPPTPSFQLLLNDAPQALRPLEAREVTDDVSLGNNQDEQTNGNGQQTEADQWSPARQCTGTGGKHQEGNGESDTEHRIAQSSKLLALNA